MTFWFKKYMDWDFGLMKLACFTLREMCPYSELFWSLFSSIRTEYGEIWSIFPYLVRIGENTDQNIYQYGVFLRSFTFPYNRSSKGQFFLIFTVLLFLLYLPIIFSNDFNLNFSKLKNISQIKQLSNCNFEAILHAKYFVKHH